MNIRITKNARNVLKNARFEAIPSKSQAHRFLICSALADRGTFITCGSSSDDIDATARCLEALGATARYDSEGFHVAPVSRNNDLKGTDFSILDCGESGSTLRFLLPVCGALGHKASFIMRGRLPDRPLSGLYSEMVSHGCVLSQPGRSPLLCEGRLEGGIYEIAGNVSSQYISGLLFALPLLTSDSLLRVTGVLESRPYVDMTLDALRLFGFTIIEEEEQCFRVPGRQTGASLEKIKVEGDWSNAAFWLSAGAIGRKGVICAGLNPASMQGDRAIIELLIRFGACVTINNDEVIVTPGRLRGIEIDASNIPDLVPVLAAVSAVAEGKTIIRGAGRLRVKESDRLRAITVSLTGLGADITETEDGLIINGKEGLKGGETESFGDHRIAMTSAVLSLACEEPILIKNAEAVNKSYPGFFNDFRSLGVTPEAV